jgi:hypothetical protein
MNLSILQNNPKDQHHWCENHVSHTRTLVASLTRDTNPVSPKHEEERPPIQLDKEVRLRIDHCLYVGCKWRICWDLITGCARPVGWVVRQTRDTRVCRCCVISQRGSSLAAQVLLQASLHRPSLAHCKRRPNRDYSNSLMVTKHLYRRSDLW